MKVLFIGGTGNISRACTDEALRRGYEVFHLNRGISGSMRSSPQASSHTDSGLHSEQPYNQQNPLVHLLKADIHDREAVARAVHGQHFDSVVQFLAFRPEQVAADIELFRESPTNSVLISTASAYKKPSLTPIITEETTA